MGQTCNCVERMRRVVQREFGETAQIENLCFSVTGEVRLSVPFSYIPQGRKGRVEKSLIYSFCPFCGKAY